MSDNVESNPMSGGPTFRTTDVDDVHHPHYLMESGVGRGIEPASTSHPFPVQLSGRAAFLDRIGVTRRRNKIFGRKVGI